MEADPIRPVPIEQIWPLRDNQENQEYPLVSAHVQSRLERNIKKQSSRSLHSNSKKYFKKIGVIKSTRYEKSFVIKSLRFWNLLPEEVKEIRNGYFF